MITVGCQQHCNITCNLLFENVVEFGSFLVPQIDG